MGIDIKNRYLTGRLLNIKFASPDGGPIYNLSAFYGPTQRDHSVALMKQITSHFTALYTSNDTNIILGDFNLVQHKIDKGRGMSRRDNMFNDRWKFFTDSSQITDPFRVQYRDKIVYSYFTGGGKSRGIGYTSTRRITTSLLTSLTTILPFPTPMKFYFSPSKHSLNMGLAIGR